MTTGAIGDGGDRPRARGRARGPRGSLGEWAWRRRPSYSAATLLLGGFTGLSLGGTALLSLPWARATGQAVGLLDGLFTATSAVCATGLVTVDTATVRSPLGLGGPALRMQLGGPGVLTFATVLLGAFVIAVERHLPEEYRFPPGTDFAFRAGDTRVVIGHEPDLRHQEGAGAAPVTALTPP